MDHDRGDAGGREEGRRGRRFRPGVASAKEAEALAKASIFQATSEKERLESAWKSARAACSLNARAETSHDHPPPGFSEDSRALPPLSRQPAAAARAAPTLPASTTSSASAMRASCTSPTRMRSCSRSISASPASISASARCRASRRIWSAAPFSTASASGPTAPTPMPSPVVDFEKAAARFGKLGGFAHLKTLIDRLRSDVGAGRSLLLDGGDLWQGTRPRQHHAGRRHGRGRQPARHRGDDRPLGIHLWREGAARQSRALQGRIPGAERLPHRGSRLQRRQGVRPRLGPRVQAVR